MAAAMACLGPLLLLRCAKAGLQRSTSDPGALTAPASPAFGGRGRARGSRRAPDARDRYFMPPIARKCGWSARGLTPGGGLHGGPHWQLAMQTSEHSGAALPQSSDRLEPVHAPAHQPTRRSHRQRGTGGAPGAAPQPPRFKQLSQRVNLQPWGPAGAGSRSRCGGRKPLPAGARPWGAQAAARRPGDRRAAWHAPGDQRRPPAPPSPASRPSRSGTWAASATLWPRPTPGEPRRQRPISTPRPCSCRRPTAARQPPTAAASHPLVAAPAPPRAGMR